MAMQEIIVTTTVDVPNCPRFKEGQKVRVSTKIADMLVERGLARYDQGKPAKTEKAKEVKKKKEEEKK